MMNENDNEHKHNDHYFQEIPNDQVMKSLQKGKRKAFFSNAMVTSAFILMILPICAVFTVIFYGWGITESRGNNFLKVVENTVAMTEPNMLVDVDHITYDLGLFSMTGTFDVYKQIGSSSTHVTTESHAMWFNKIDQPRRTGKQADYFTHPDEQLTLNKHSVDKRLPKLPEGTVAEMFISLEDSYTEEDIDALFREFDVEVVWYAVSDGKTNGDRQLIGYPAEDGVIDSSFNEKQDNQQQFIDGLHFLSNYEEQVETISSLDVKEIIDYIEQNKAEIYGVVLTGPTKEFLDLDELAEVRDYKLGDVALWNWE